MKVWVLKYEVTDGCTYSCREFLGVFETEEAAAIKAAILHFEDPENEEARVGYR